jgi:hypothetical protein
MESIASQVLASSAQPEQTPIETKESGGIEDILAQLNGDPAEKVAEPTEEVVEAPKSEDPRLSLLAKMERKLKLQEQAFKQKELELEQKYSKYKDYEGIDSDIEKDPFKYLSKKGWDMEKLNRHYLETAEEEDLDPVAKKFKDFDSKLEQTKAELRKEYEEKLAAKEQEIRNKDYENQINQFKSEMKTFIASNKDQYELINAEENGLDIVYDVIYQDLQNQVKAGKQGNDLAPMDIKVAADRVEQYLDTQVQKYLNLNKYKVKKSQDPTSLDDVVLKLNNNPKTIDSSFTPKSISVDQLSDEERIKAATDLVKRGFNF